MKPLLSLALVVVFGLADAGCASKPPLQPQTASTATCDPERDRQSILAMAGSYDVVFDFAETEALTAGYQLHSPHKSYATELVLPIENEPGHVALQHILQLGDGPDASVVKHWRQDWTFQNTELLEFQGRDAWQRRSLPKEAVQCTWTQAVFGVDDAPRYAGFGHWQHDAAGSVWTSNETWRPLPRREYTTRSDYDVLIAVNRHRITQDGWEHEQDNRKLVLDPRHVLAREHGLNSYTHASPRDTSAAAAYWRATAPFWAAVRTEWTRLFARTPQLRLQNEAAGKQLHETLFERADRRLPVDASTEAFIRRVLEGYVAAAPANLQTAASH